jgi:hypothetical protein
MQRAEGSTVLNESTALNKLLPCALRIGLAALLGTAAGCSVAGKAPHPFEFIVKVASEPGEPVIGASIVHDGTVLGTTDALGVFKLVTSGGDGETFLVDIRCPQNLHSPQKPVAILLRRLSETQTRPQYDVTCAPRTRTMVVAIRADAAINLPVRRLGSEIARTDGSGAALVALDVAPDEPIDLTLDTSSRPWLKPRDPTQRFQIDDSDGLFVFNQSFIGEPHKLRIGRKRSGPIRIGPN